MKKINTFFNQKFKAAHIITLAVVAALILAVMDFYLIPTIQETAKIYGYKVLDMYTFGYSMQDVQGLIENLSDRQLYLYKFVQLPLDMVFPIVYTLLFAAILSKLGKGTGKLLYLPFALFVFDYCENILSFIILNSSAELNTAVYVVASFATVCKNILLIAVILISLVLFIIKVLKKRKSK